MRCLVLPSQIIFSLLFFNSHDDEYRTLLPFIKEGLECGEKVVHTIDPERHDEHFERLARAGIDVVAARERSQF